MDSHEIDADRLEVREAILSKDLDRAVAMLDERFPGVSASVRIVGNAQWDVPCAALGEPA
jgi:hypothetical protein